MRKNPSGQSKDKKESVIRITYFWPKPHTFSILKNSVFTPPPSNPRNAYSYDEYKLPSSKLSSLIPAIFPRPEVLLVMLR